jgi:hypothetical protein
MAFPDARPRRATNQLRILIFSPPPKQLTVSNLFQIISAEAKKYAAPDFRVIAV